MTTCKPGPRQPTTEASGAAEGVSAIVVRAYWTDLATALRMAVVSNRELVAGYWRNYQLAISEDRAEKALAQDWAWALKEVNEAAIEADDGVVELLVRLAEAAPSAQASAYLGAGPLEELIRLHGPALIDEIDQAARRSEPFRLALRSVWYGSDADPSLVATLQRFGPSP